MSSGGSPARYCMLRFFFSCLFSGQYAVSTQKKNIKQLPIVHAGLRKNLFFHFFGSFRNLAPFVRDRIIFCHLLQRCLFTEVQNISANPDLKKKRECILFLFFKKEVDL